MTCFLLSKITIPSSVTSIKESAFEECISLTSIKLPSSINYIGEYCFFECHSLTRIEIPPSVTLIEDSTFRECSSLIEILLPPKLTKIGNHCFEGCISLKEISIPSSVTHLGCFSFKNCSSLKEIEIPPSVTVIEPYTFANCTSLMKVLIPNSVVSLGDYSFSSCISLKEITIPSSVILIGESSFYKCESLENISIPSSVKEIEDRAFLECISMKSFSIPSSVTKVGHYVFFEYDESTKSSNYDFLNPSNSLKDQNENESDPNINHHFKSKYKINRNRFQTKEMRIIDQYIYLIREKKTQQLFVDKIEPELTLYDNEKISNLTRDEIKLRINANHSTFIKFFGYSFQDENINNLNIIMKYKKNSSLKELIHSIQIGMAPIEYDNTKRQIILIGIACAMKYLHDCQIHCIALNPSKILLNRDFQPQISCSFIKKSRIIAELNHGNNQYFDVYLSPELITDSKYCEKSDVYSYGMIMYEVLTDFHPFGEYRDRCTAQQLFDKIVRCNLRPKIPEYACINEPLKQLIEQCWSPKPEERPTFKEIFQKLAYDKNYYIDYVDEVEIEVYVDYITSE